MDRAARHPVNALLSNVMYVALIVGPPHRLEVDHGKQREEIVGQQKEVAQEWQQARPLARIRHVISINDHPKHEYGAKYRIEAKRNEWNFGGAAIDERGEYCGDQQNPPFVRNGAAQT